MQRARVMSVRSNDAVGIVVRSTQPMFSMLQTGGTRIERRHFESPNKELFLDPYVFGPFSFVLTVP